MFPLGSAVVPTSPASARGAVAPAPATTPEAATVAAASPAVPTAPTAPSSAPAPAAVPAATIAPSAEPAKAEPVTAPPKSAAVSAPVLALESTLKSPAKAESPAPPAPLSPKLAARMDAGLGLLDTPGEKRFVVQLMMTDARQRDYLEWYVGEASRALPPDTLFLYPSGNAESPKMGVLYGAFATRREATSAMEGLPANLRKFGPYVRTVEGVRSDVRKGPPA